MNIKQALKKKNRLTSKLKDLQVILYNHNSIDEGNTRRFNMNDTVKEYDEVIAELVTLKTKINKANTPVYSKIFLMSELKSQIKVMKSIPVVEGFPTARFGGSSQVKKVVEITALDVLDKVEVLEAKIDELQDELDVYNVNTEI